MRQFLDNTLRKWFVAPSSGVHFDVADGIRGLAILAVVMSHGFYSNPNGPQSLIVLQKAIGTGALGVQIFFVLSGFLLSLPFFRARNENPHFWYPPGFATRRALKIVPPFYLTILLLVLWNYFVVGDPGYVTAGAAWATGIAHFVHFPKELNGSFWSLWVEIGFYAILPFLFFAVPGRNHKQTGIILLLFLIVVAVLGRLVFWQGPDDPRNWFFVTSRFPCSLDTFGWGILFGSIYATQSKATPEAARRLGRLGYLGIFLMAVAAFYVFWMDSFHAGEPKTRIEVELRHFLPGIGAFFLLFLVFDKHFFATRLLSTTFFRFLGIVSFEWFLIHQPVMMIYRDRMGSAHGNLLRYLHVILLPAAVTLVVAVILYHQYSLPIMKWGRRKVERRLKGQQ